MHLSRWISPHVDKMYWPLLMKNCTLGSERLSLIRPSFSWSIWAISWEFRTTLTRPIEIVWSRTKFGQDELEEIVPVFITISSRPPIPTIEPAGTSSTNFKLLPMSKNKCSMTVSLTSYWPFNWCLGPITNTFWPTLNIPLKTRLTAIILVFPVLFCIAFVAIS